MSNIYMYAHGGSGNHGCEAIVRSTVKLLNEFKSGNEIVLISSNPEEDRKYGIDNLCRIEKDKLPYSKMNNEFIGAYLALKIKHDYIPLDRLDYKTTINQINKGDIAISIGGDNYCYADVKKYTMLHDMMLKRGAKTVLWGCSVEPELTLIPEIAEDLKRYSLITARETISYQALKKINPNTVLVSDSAFLLDTIHNQLPHEFQEYNMVGINISPMIINNENLKGIAMKNYEELIKYILQKTDMGIALIPHVVWEGGDDRITLQKLYEKFQENDRVVLCQDQSCEEIKGIISKCRFFVGARTHSTIAAYSSGVPTLVVGYSVKARGIAQDLFGTDENYVIPVQNMIDEFELEKTFRWLVENEKDVREKLTDSLVICKERVRKAIEALKRMV